MCVQFSWSINDNTVSFYYSDKTLLRIKILHGLFSQTIFIFSPMRDTVLTTKRTTLCVTIGLFAQDSTDWTLG